MIGYITLGTNDLAGAKAFYNSLLAEIGVALAYETEKLVAWQFAKGPLLGVTLPYDGESATIGNGSMVALQVSDPASVDRLHALALELGASDEGAPGPRGQGFYGAYFRDLDGNKLNLHCFS